MSKTPPSHAGSLDRGQKGKEGFPGVPRDFYGFQELPDDSQGFLGIPWGFNQRALEGFPRILRDSWGFLGNPSDSVKGLSRDSLGFLWFKELPDNSQGFLEIP
ncbi:hypothetical protein PoB_003234800 [Plakobranchus ocellatus]|uniref:Uncharacterized protein n=1 Tax=Plakobranchus ocellatus TaxID=259542 RepID=A0AAV4AEZ8_9GAST|nr:hypothetical protein PoB_003234800 [Plakobranchus ocellatus]